MAPQKKTILTVAVTGNLTTVQQNPALPCTPEQIASAALESAKIGAAVAHIHVRYPDGRPSMELAHYREVVDRIRDKNSDLILNLTTGPGGRFVPSKEDPRVAGPGTSILHPLKRVEHIVELKPDIATLDLNTMWSGSAAVINTPDNVTIMANEIQKAGSTRERVVLRAPPLFQMVMGVRYGFISTPQTLMYAHSLLPKDAMWAAFAIGRWEFPMLATAWFLGGHVRGGMEEHFYLSKGQLTPSNAALCEKAVRILDNLGAELASAKEARQILGLRAR